MICVLLVNEIRLMANVIGAAIEDEEDIKIVGRVTTVEDALARAPMSDVILVSTRLPDQGALRLLQAIDETGLSAKVLVLGLAESEAEIIGYVEAGAAGYVLKDDSIDLLLKNVRAAYNGEALISPEIASALMSRVADLAQVFADVDVGAGAPGDLTPREVEVLELIGKGLTNQEIAERLVIEVGTVKNHVHSILQTLNVSSREDAAAFLAILDQVGED